MSSNKNKIIQIIGLGYIGLPTAATFALNKTQVIGVDVNKKVVEIINKGKIHISEPNLENIVKTQVKSGRLIARNSITFSDVFIITVPTPFKKVNHEPDLSYVYEAVDAIADFLKKGSLIILESTSPVGTTEQIAKRLSRIRKDLKFPLNDGDIKIDVNLAYCPERVLPGNILNELINNDRIIGGITRACSVKAKKIYETFLKGNCYITNSRTAEMVKLTENSFRDVNIAFANELSILSDKLKINVWELIKLANKHPRVDILNPGPGVGGHCIAVDPWFIVNKNPEEAKIIRTARMINDKKADWVINKVNKLLINFKKNNKPTRIPHLSCYGIAFKPDIDDLRESPAVKIVSKLLKKKIKVSIVEPNIVKLPNNLNKATLMDASDSLKKADIHLFLVSHKEFKKLKPNTSYLIDTVGLFKKNENY